MKTNDGLISADEFFSAFGPDKKNRSTVPRPREKKAGKDLFTKIKENLVMRVYGVSRAEAIKVVAKRGKAVSGPKSGKNRSAAAMSRRTDMIDDITVDDFFEDCTD